MKDCNPAQLLAEDSVDQFVRLRPNFVSDFQRILDVHAVLPPERALPL
jgi:hypothetical protein